MLIDSYICMQVDAVSQIYRKSRTGLSCILIGAMLYNHKDNNYPSEACNSQQKNGIIIKANVMVAIEHETYTL